jgi:hypothetical protein
VTDEEIRICVHDGEPLVWTFEFRSFERYCVVCGAKYGMFGPPTAVATVELQRRHIELTERYERERAIREGKAEPEPKPMLEPPSCIGCGKHPDVMPPGRDKPAHWYSRVNPQTLVKEFACSRSCVNRAPKVFAAVVSR